VRLLVGQRPANLHVCVPAAIPGDGANVDAVATIVRHDDHRSESIGISGAKAHSSRIKGAVTDEGQCEYVS
jgi:hypothetical protein